MPTGEVNCVGVGCLLCQRKTPKPCLPQVRAYQCNITTSHLAPVSVETGAIMVGCKFDLWLFSMLCTVYALSILVMSSRTPTCTHVKRSCARLKPIVRRKRPDRKYLLKQGSCGTPKNDEMISCPETLRHELDSWPAMRNAFVPLHIR
jgi:hypothetical protein